MSNRFVNSHWSLSTASHCKRCCLEAVAKQNRRKAHRHASSAAAVQFEINEESGSSHASAGQSSKASVATNTPPQTARSSRLQASKTRSILASLSPGHLSSLRTLQAALRPKKSQTEFSRLEVHAVAHHLVRSKRKALSASFVAEAVDKGEIGTQRRRGEAVHKKTILHLVAAQGGARAPRENHHLRFISQASNFDTFNHAALQPLQPSILLSAQLQLLQSLLKVRHPRSPGFYTSLIDQCLYERLPDLAATVYVGLVEEWITEGRVAQGASLADFHEGGGPARSAEQGPRFPSPTTQERNRWFQGVRTWRIPGETLSPHDRLDLWHPLKLALPEKMRNFPLPLPTSPPSLVPEPSSKMMNVILGALRLVPGDPKTSPVHFAASARALAILANTVHNRTLPIGALPALLVAFRALPHHPMIFPASFQSAPEKEAYAFSASSHVHGALLSLLLSPPTYPHHIRIQSRSFASALSEMFAQSRAAYIFPPLSIKSCNVLLQYALSKLKRPAILTNLLVYMKEATGGVLPTMSLNILYRSGTLLRRNDIAEPAQRALFGDLQTSTEASSSDEEVVPEVKQGRVSKVTHDKQAVHFMAPLSPPLPSAAAAQAAVAITEDVLTSEKPDEHSLVALIAHLTATSQFSRLKSLVTTLIPRTRGDWKESAVRVPLSPHIYGALLNGLCKAGAIGLARTVYIDAKEAESASWGEVRTAVEKAAPLSTKITLGWFVPIHAYTSMLKMIPQTTAQLSRDSEDVNYGSVAEIGRKTALHLHKDMCGAVKWASSLTQHLGPQIALSPPQPDVRYFNAHVEACAGAWILADKLKDEVQSAMSAEAFEHLQGIVTDMDTLGVPVPDALREVSGGVESANPYRRNKEVKTRGWEVSRYWSSKSKPAREMDQRRLEEVEADWILGVERGRLGKE